MLGFFKQMLFEPTAEEILARDLDDAQRARLSHLKSAEEHSAWVQMLDQRIARIQAERPQIIPPNHCITE